MNVYFLFQQNSDTFYFEDFKRLMLKFDAIY